MSFGENVGYFRRQLNITQEELAEHLFVSRQTVSRWETDSTFPDVETIIMLCDLFGCDMDILVRGNAQDSKDASEKKKNDGVDVIKEMKEQLKKKRLLSERIVGGVAAPTAILSIFAYFLIGLIWGIWHPTWVIFIGAITIIAVTAVVADTVIGVSSDAKKIGYEKRKFKKK